MLVLSRKEGQSIIISPAQGVDPNMTVAEFFEHGFIEVSLGRISGDQAKICFSATELVKITRSELVYS